jgi:hypothetical protein
MRIGAILLFVGVLAAIGVTLGTAGNERPEGPPQSINASHANVYVENVFGKEYFYHGEAPPRRIEVPKRDPKAAIDAWMKRLAEEEARRVKSNSETDAHALPGYERGWQRTYCTFER